MKKKEVEVDPNPTRRSVGYDRSGSKSKHQLLLTLSEPESIANPELVHPSNRPVLIRLQEVIREFNASLFSTENGQSDRLVRTGMLDAIHELGNHPRPDSTRIVNRRLANGKCI